MTIKGMSRGKDDGRLRVLQRGLREGALRPCKPIMLAQRLALVRCTEKSAPLQYRYHLRAEHVQHRRQQWRHDVEAVGGAVLEPVFDQIGDLLGRSGGGEMA